MKTNTFDNIKKLLMIILILTLIIVFVVLLIVSKNNKVVDNINEFIANDTKVLYISDKEHYSSYHIDLFEQYEIEYLYVDSTNLSTFEKNKISKIINNKSLENIIIIFKNKKVVDVIIDYKTEENLNQFLQDNNILPKILSNPEGIIDKAKEYLETDLTVIYIPYVYNEQTDSQALVLNELANSYEISYERIDAYLLSYYQKEKLNSILQISSVEDQIVILIKNNKIVGSIRGYNSKNDYLNYLYEYNIISNIKNNIEEIDYDVFKTLIQSTEKNIILIEKSECKYCDETTKILNRLIDNYNISVKRININDFNSELSKNIEQDLIDLGYNEGFTTPLVIILESNKLLDFIIGVANEQYFVDIFTENGIIK